MYENVFIFAVWMTTQEVLLKWWCITARCSKLEYHKFKTFTLMCGAMRPPVTRQILSYNVHHSNLIFPVALAWKTTQLLTNYEQALVVHTNTGKLSNKKFWHRCENLERIKYINREIHYFCAYCTNAHDKRKPHKRNISLWRRTVISSWICKISGQIIHSGSTH